MLEKITIFLPDDTINGLLTAGKQNHRSPTGEAAWIIENDLARRGLVKQNSHENYELLDVIDAVMAVNSLRNGNLHQREKGN